MTDASLKQQLQSDIKDAMRAKSDSLTTLRSISAQIKQKEIDERIEVTDTNILTILDKMCKQRQESIKQFTDAGRSDLVEKEAFELNIIKTYLPEPLTEAEVASMIDEAIASTGAESMKDMGKVMAELKSKMQGRADMSQVSKLIKGKF